MNEQRRGIAAASGIFMKVIIIFVESETKACRSQLPNKMENGKYKI